MRPVLILAFLPVSLFGTTVVVLRTPNAIFVGVDSKVSSSVGSGRDGETCKIGEISNSELFAQSGFDTYGNDIRGVVGDFRAVTRKALQGPGKFERRIASYETQMLKALRDLLSPAWANIIPPDKRQPDAILMETIFLKFRNNKPVVEARGFVYRNGTAVREPKLTSHCLEDCASPLMYFAAGERDKLSIPLVRQTVKELGIVPAINKLIGLEAAAHPDTTGGQTVIARLDSSGITYVQPGTCN